MRFQDLGEISSRSRRESRRVFGRRDLEISPGSRRDLAEISVKILQGLDQFFIDAFYKNKWSLNKNVPKSAIEGFEYGESGLWKRICEKPYKVNGRGIREYLDYPSKMEFSPFYKGDKLQTKFFSWEGEKLDINTNIGPLSKVKFIAAWFSLSHGTFGLTLKPKLMQIMFRERENIFDQCLLEVEERENEECNLEPVT